MIFSCNHCGNIICRICAKLINNNRYCPKCFDAVSKPKIGKREKAPERKKKRSAKKPSKKTTKRRIKKSSKKSSSQVKKLSKKSTNKSSKIGKKSVNKTLKKVTGKKYH